MAFITPKFRAKAIANFYPRANEMRAKFDEFFATPAQDDYHNFVWNYWHVKEHYLYFRAYPNQILGDALYNDFMAYMVMLAKLQLECETVSGGYMALYTNGCHQTCHSDMMNGSYAYVYSLTNWENRSFSGGETHIAKADTFDALEPRRHMGQTSYFDSYPAHFNQLLLFDDRVAHMVPVIQGTMDPTQGRIVISGHIY